MLLALILVGSFLIFWVIMLIVRPDSDISTDDVLAIRYRDHSNKEN